MSVCPSIRPKQYMLQNTGRITSMGTHAAVVWAFGFHFSCSLSNSNNPLSNYLISIILCYTVKGHNVANKFDNQPDRLKHLGDIAP